MLGKTWTTGRHRLLLDSYRILRHHSEIKSNAQPAFQQLTVTRAKSQFSMLKLHCHFIQKCFNFCPEHENQLIGVLLKLVGCNSRRVKISSDLCHITLPYKPPLHKVPTPSFFFHLMIGSVMLKPRQLRYPPLLAARDSSNCRLGCNTMNKKRAVADRCRIRQIGR